MSFTPCPECRSGCTESCFAEKARSVQIGTVSQMRSSFAAKDAQISRDNDAYRRLRKDDIQPEHVDGSAQLEARLDHLPPRDPTANDSRVVSLKDVA